MILFRTIACLTVILSINFSAHSAQNDEMNGVMKIVHSALDGNGVRFKSCSDGWSCKAMIDPDKGISFENVRFFGKSACGDFSGTSPSGNATTNNFVIPDYEGDSIYLKVEEINGHASPASDSYEAAKRKYCKN